MSASVDDTQRVTASAEHLSVSCHRCSLCCCVIIWCIAMAVSVTPAPHQGLHLHYLCQLYCIDIALSLIHSTDTLTP